MASSLVLSWVCEVSDDRTLPIARIWEEYTDDCTARAFPAVLGYGVALSTVLVAFEYTNGLYGYKKDHSEDEFERRQKLRKNYQTPAEQTFAELGEGRGMLRPWTLLNGTVYSAL